MQVKNKSFPAALEEKNISSLKKNPILNSVIHELTMQRTRSTWEVIHAPCILNAKKRAGG